MESEVKIYQQWAKDVGDYSSQYGSEASMSYTASNITGPSSIYPICGDFAQAAVLRTYGTWWESAPSARKQIKRTPRNFTSKDFIELWFEREVFPTKVEIFETYNPGAVVRILACDNQSKNFNGNGASEKKQLNVRWFVLWEGFPEAVDGSRCFSPNLIRCPFSTDILRIEFNSSLCGYYTGLDAVRLKEQIESITETLTKLHLQDINGLSAALDISDNGYFDLLPGEVIQEILSFLDLPSLCRLATVSHLLYKHCCDPLQFKELNLQPYWTRVNDYMLTHLSCRCRHLQKLDLSWCGAFRSITAEGFTRLVLTCNIHLKNLRLANCSFVNNDVIKAICKSCPNIIELDLQGCSNVDNFGYAHVSHLRLLRSINLYRSIIDIHALIAIIRSCNQLEILNLGSCSNVNDFDAVVGELAAHCKLVCLDLWRARSLSSGLKILSQNCRRLEEIDLGWCSNLQSNSGCFLELFQNCRQLKKVFITANRTVCDQDLEALAACCPLLEQLDILGNSEVGVHTIERVMQCCPKLKLLDVSFCAEIGALVVE
ncbi:hypothetical protein CAPTEDRAFT_180630, partial [Capitella teleta]